MDLQTTSRVFLFILCIFGTQGIVVYEYSTSQKTWLAAANYCKTEYNGTLYISDSSKVTELPQKQSYWSGKYSIMSSWITLKGCYSHIGASGFTKVLKLENNSPIRCQIYCTGSQLFAVKNDSCICIGRTLPSSFRKAYMSSCSNICVKSVYFCGGSSFYSVYILENFQSDTTIKDNKCVGAQCQHNTDRSNSVLYYGRNCTENYRPICYTKIEGKLIAMNANYSANWTTAYSTCFTENNTTMVSFLGAKCPYNFLPLFNEKFWIGIFRDSAIFTVKDLYIPVGKQEECYSITKGQRHGITEKSRSCSDMLPFICQYDAEYQSTASTSLPVTSTTLHITSEALTSREFTTEPEATSTQSAPPTSVATTEQSMFETTQQRMSTSVLIKSTELSTLETTQQEKSTIAEVQTTEQSMQETTQQRMSTRVLIKSTEHSALETTQQEMSTMAQVQTTEQSRIETTHQSASTSVPLQTTDQILLETTRQRISTGFAELTTEQNTLETTQRATSEITSQEATSQVLTTQQPDDETTTITNAQSTKTTIKQYVKSTPKPSTTPYTESSSTTLTRATSTTPRSRHSTNTPLPATSSKPSTIRTTSKPSKSSTTGKNLESHSESNSSSLPIGPIAGGGGGGVVLLIIIIAILLMYRKRKHYARHRRGSNVHTNNETSGINRECENPMYDTTNGPDPAEPCPQNGDNHRSNYLTPTNSEVNATVLNPMFDNEIYLQGNFGSSSDVYNDYDEEDFKKRPKIGSDGKSITHYPDAYKGVSHV